MGQAAGLLLAVWPQDALVTGRRIALDLFTLWLARQLWNWTRPRLAWDPTLWWQQDTFSLETKSPEDWECQFDLGRDTVPPSPLSPGTRPSIGTMLPSFHLECSSPSSPFGTLSEPRLGEDKLVLVMVGLPARGKSYITRHIHRYLTFEGFGVRDFNAGDYRRKLLGAGQDAAFFDPENEEGRRKRRECSNAALDDLLQWLEHTEGAHVGILDATNSTAERRAGVLWRCAQAPGVRVAFLESICTDEEVLEKNYALKLQNKDYAGWDEEAARKDFLQRTAQYEQVYETIEDNEGNGDISFMKILNCGEKLVQRHCEGYLVSKVTGYMQNLHVEPRVIYLTRHGLSEDNAAEILGGDSKLTSEGTMFARRLRDFMRQQLGLSEGSSAGQDVSGPRGGWLLVTSQLRRACDTARPMVEDTTFIAKSGMRRVHTALLNEIAAGIYDGFSMKQFKRKAPEEYHARVKDKLRYRYPRGESYLDLVQRVRPVVMEIEREKRPALVIAHQAVLRTIVAFFQGTPLEEMPELEIPLHTVLQLTITPHGCDVQRVVLGETSNLPTSSSNDSLAGSACSTPGGKAFSGLEQLVPVVGG